MQSTSRVDQKLEKNTSELLKREGLITPNEQFETIYLADDEIEQFMDKYLRENPGTEVETRYISHPPIELTQNIEVRWLRPETPEIPPIIIKEVEDPNAPRAPTPPPLRIVQKSRPQQQPEEPIVIREKPPMMTIAEPKFAYVQNVVKRQVSKSGTANTGTSNNSQSTFSRAGVGAAVVGRSRLDYEEQRSERDTMNYSYEEHGGSIVDYDEVVEEYEEVVRTSGGQSRGGGAGEHDEHMMMMSETATHTAATTAVTAPAHSGVGQTPRAGRHLHLQRTYEDEHQLRIYEEKLKKTLYEEYLLRLERERLERKLSRSGLLEERIRERSISQDRLSAHQQLMDDAKYRAIFTHIPGHNEMRHHIIRERNTQSLEKDQANTIATSQPSVSTQQQQQQQQPQNPYLQLPPPLPQTSQQSQPAQQQQPQQQPQKFYLQSQSHTSSYKNIKFTRVTDETDLERLNSILDNPKSPVLDSRGQVAETIAKSLGTGDLERRLAGLTDPPTNVVVPVHDVSEIINTPAPSKPVVIRIRPIQTNNTTQPNRTDKQNNNNNINNNNNNNNNNSEPNEQYFAIISSKITNKNISSQSQKQQQPQQQPLRQFDRIYAADGIANINDLATDKRSNYTNQGLSTNNLIKDISATSSATKGVAIDSDPYYQRRYPKQQQQQQPQQINEPKLISYEEQLRIESNIKSFFPHLNYPIINVK